MLIRQCEPNLTASEVANHLTVGRRIEFTSPDNFCVFKISAIVNPGIIVLMRARIVSDEYKVSVWACIECRRELFPRDPAFELAIP